MLAVLLCFTAQAQPASSEPVDFMHSNGRIYVVMAVVLAILIGLFIYVYSLDRKISKLEKS
ncbi:MAG: CcmD family protein [Chitinophagaceae bacterium]|nr:CcmD family protein [Chitinophagaceae bacterium]